MVPRGGNVCGCAPPFDELSFENVRELYKKKGNRKTCGRRWSTCCSVSHLLRTNSTGKTLKPLPYTHSIHGRPEARLHPLQPQAASRLIST
jgi:hypothetical protein